MLRSSPAKVLPALGLTSICVTLSMWYSTGFSTVMTFFWIAVDLVQAGVQGGALAGAGRAADDEQAVRLVDEVVDLLAHLVAHAEVRQVGDLRRRCRGCA